jgi:hypothetical protein
MAHHLHDNSDSYFMDQICLIALGGAFAAVCLTLYFWQTPMLTRILAPQFHQYILWSGIVLLIMVLVRAAVIWKAAGQPALQTAANGAAAIDQDHHHHEDHAGHSHCEEGCSHTHEAAHHHHHHHGEGEECSGAGRDHDHAHEAGDACCGEAGHDHSHDNAWTPLKCLVLLAPIVFYLMGLPTTILGARDTTSEANLTVEAENSAAIMACGFAPLNQAVLVGSAALADPTEGEIHRIGFAELEGTALDEQARKYWNNKIVEVPGQFVPSRQSDRVFTLARMRISCCAIDAVQLHITMVSREPITGFTPQEWVKVVGRVEFRRNPNSGHYDTYLQVKGPRSISPTAPDPNPYLTTGSGPSQMVPGQ